MSFVIPDAHKVDLRAALEAQGWDVEAVESAADAWWMNELWRIRSRWRPVGVELFVSFVGDRMDDRRPPRRVEDIGVGREAVSRVSAENIERFALHPDWPAQLLKIVAHAAKLRDASV
jgi:hypothetical protein